MEIKTIKASEIRLGDIDRICKTYHCMRFERLTTVRGEPYLTETRVYKEDHKTLSSYKREIMSRLNWAIKAGVKVTFSFQAKACPQYFLKQTNF